MADTKWMIKGREFANCNCSYGCPCQFNGLPTYGDCRAVVGYQIEQGFHGSTKLDDLRFVTIFRWPGAVHEGKGEAAVIIDERATEAQRGVLLRIITGQDTEKLHDPIFAPIEFQVDIAERKARLVVPGITEGRGEPILNPVTGAAHRVRIDMVGGFEYELAEIGRGWTKTSQPIKFELTDSYGQFAEINLCQSGIVR